MQRVGSGNIRQKMIKMEGPSRSKRRRPQRRLVDIYTGILKGDMQMVGVTKEDATERERVRWRQMIHGNPWIEEKKDNLPVRM